MNYIHSLQLNGPLRDIPNDAKARAQLGFAPRALEVGLRETLEFERALLAQAEQPLRP